MKTATNSLGSRISAKGRIHLTAGELEQIARCPHSINYLERTLHRRQCPHCIALNRIGGYILQRNFREGRNMPGISTIERHAIRALVEHGVDTDEAAALACSWLGEFRSLLLWGKGVADNIAIIKCKAELHYGPITVYDLIPGVLYTDNLFSAIQFTCGAGPMGAPHRAGDLAMNYRSLHRIAWIRDHFDVEEAGITVVHASPTGIEYQTIRLDIDATILSGSIQNILLGVVDNLPTDTRDTDAVDTALHILPRIIGEHCWSCMACFTGPEISDGTN